MDHKQKIELITEACTLIFNLKKIDCEDGYFHFDLDCVSSGEFLGFNSKTFFCSFSINDFERLIQYIDTHCQILLEGDGWYESPVYVPTDFDLQIQCFDGEIVNYQDGCLSIRILFNCGPPNEGQSNAYIGFESVIDVINLREFRDDIATLVGHP